MKSSGILKALTAFIGLVNAIPAPTPAAELAAEDLIKLSEGVPIQKLKLEKRIRCNSDNVYRRLRDKRYSSSASGFCSKFIQSTVTETTEVADTLTTITATTLPPVTVTVTDVSTLTETEFSTSTSFIPTTVIPKPQLAKRDEQEAYPPWLPEEYPPWRVSSACSCYLTDAPPPPATRTVTITTATVTVFSETLTITPPPSTVTESATIVTTITSVISVTKVINCDITPGCRRFDRPNSNYEAGLTREQCFALCAATDGCLSIQFGIGGSVPGVCFVGPYTVEDTIEPEISAVSPICLWWVMEDLECKYLD